MGLGLTVSTLLAQPTVPSQIRAENVIDRISFTGLTKGDLIFGIPVMPGKTIDHFYMDEHWGMSSLLLYGSEKPIEGYYVKYDLKNRWIEISIKKEVHVLDCQKIKYMTLIDSVTQQGKYFINTKEFDPGERPDGLMEMLSEGKVSLVRLVNFSIRKSDYVPAFDMGRKDEGVIKNESYYLLKEKGLTKVKNKQTLLAFAGEYKNDLENFMDGNHLKISREEDLKRSVAFLNKLQEGNLN